MKVDLHVHTKERSRCGRSSVLEQIQAAVSAGLGAIAFTDHGQLPPVEEIARLNDEYAPLRILEGIEITVNGEDVLVVGVRDPLIVAEKWEYPSLHGFVRARGGFIAVAHPFRYHADITIPIQAFPPDAIEVCSMNTPRRVAEQIVALAQGLGIPVLSNSDAHATDALGKYYNLLDHEPGCEEELLNMIKGGRFTPVMHDVDGTTKTFMRRDIRAHNS